MKRRKTNWPGLAIEAPAGKGARGLLDVLLAVVAFAEREKLHHFAGEILVRRALAVLRVVEIDDHRRVARDGVQQVREIAERVGAQRRVLPVHQLRELDLLLAGDEMVVPEKGHPLGQRRRCRQHLADPPAAQLEAFADLLLLEHFLFDVGCVLSAARIAQRSRFGSPRRRRIDRARTRAVQQISRRPLARHANAALDLAFRRAESRAVEQMPRIVVAERVGGGSGGSGNERQ